ncbi:MAG: hypothetical protein COZ49_03300 [Candidatus Yonathbacteria bacterium CG_4_10_14_3_um_filter_47_65]|uniref:MgtC/SapB/SrpB/YhiD N-terminal domain-containing protein n=2 Tax=Parcubacteria group TaxID=1794811 RepID=A0A2M8D5U6_9BACT|nr:MAG: hypothetical protein AUJ44_02100 [Candidatus Nomurabacteria bacterium CG1_02_47_685]PIP03238.1 MAG: hypothetical protein COX54_04320 [Candidatus Yonathbacteria bacterium CG23_combo_of_CG06-09_8_20_14_all_46_18]PIQ32126.1 MAG: hypothetical protein COW61_02200 [Candidatus Yonathbacteria bacterium CG17_big_fil_post_rev_8_21_14_2_50_46_19]PIX56206.1 MAG: hypothetical protein COZ49_03300 [Candidatus Yonathbacteria bacterium CG_4_10_14_3_um_filter_47_65]PIY57745.1 MAG: hypothetical protein CO
MELSFFETLHIFQGLVLAAVLGMVLGAERIIAGKTAGMRTYGLVSMGAALFVVISSMVSRDYIGSSALDPLRVASQIVVGIGFLGAGLIIFKDSRVSGLTTAAGLWVAAGIGMAAGFELYIIAVFATVLTLLVFSLVWYVEYHIVKKFKIGYWTPSENDIHNIHNGS